MRKHSFLLYLVALLLILSVVAVPGVYALWYYYNTPASINTDVSTKLSLFEYGLIYITQVKQAEPSGAYNSASVQKSGATDVHADIDLGATANASASYEITFYNSTDTVYYYNEAQTLSSNNTSIAHTVTGIAQKDAVEAKTYKTLTVTFSYGQAPNNTSLSADIHFSFVVDKDSIGIIVAKTAVDRFRDILNNVASPDSYDTLESAMNAKGGGWNAASDVTYIGNVSGSTNTDTQTVESLFGTDFMSMDLDGDGTPEPITVMIKRENLDNNIETGADYSYLDRRGAAKYVYGAEMTLYITAQNLNNVDRNDEIVVYAATYTIPSGGTKWIELVPLTQGIASANNYSGSIFGSANSFNTDTWISDSQKSMDELAQEAAG